MYSCVCIGKEDICGLVVCDWYVERDKEEE